MIESNDLCQVLLPTVHFPCKFLQLIERILNGANHVGYCIQQAERRKGLDINQKPGNETEATPINLHFMKWQS